MINTDVNKHGYIQIFLESCFTDVNQYKTFEIAHARREFRKFYHTLSFSRGFPGESLMVYIHIFIFK